MAHRPLTLFHIVAGPDSGRTLQLGPGRQVIGRAEGAGQIDDPALEAHHALIDVAADGQVRLLQLTGRFPLRVDGRTTVGWTALSAGSVIELGHSRLHVEGPGASHPFRLAGDGVVELGYRRKRLGDDRAADRPDRCCVDLVDFHRIAIEGSQAVAAAAAIVAQLNASPNWNVTALADVSGFISAPAVAGVRELVICRVGHLARCTSLWTRPDVSALVLVAPGQRVPSWCRSLLVVGETWRGEWWADLHGSVTDVERLHLRGVRPPLPATIPDLVPTTRPRRCREPLVGRDGAIDPSEVALDAAIELGNGVTVTDGRGVWPDARRSGDTGRRRRAPPLHPQGSRGRTR